MPQVVLPPENTSANSSSSKMTLAMKLQGSYVSGSGSPSPPDLGFPTAVLHLAPSQGPIQAPLALSEPPTTQMRQVHLCNMAAIHGLVCVCVCCMP